jgi:TM2 domain-containing membrane protein YozV
MKLFNNVVKGASSQFGREFGRAAANKILKGANSYNINSDAYIDRIKPSDSNVIKAIKNINKISFISNNKGNISRLLNLQNIITPFLYFDGINTLNQLNDYNILFNLYNNKKDEGFNFIDTNFTDKSLDLLNNKTEEIKILINKFNNDIKEFVEINLAKAKQQYKSKKTTTLLCFFLGSLGIHKFYLNNTNGFVYIIFCWTIIPSIIALIETIIYLFMSKQEFDLKYNKNYVYYNQFNINEK